MIQFDDREIVRFEHMLRTFADRAFPFATRNTINDAAFETMRKGKRNLQRDRILKSPFSKKSIRVTPERVELNVSRQQAVVGSIADHLEKLEFGNTRVGGRHGVPIQTSFAAGQEGRNPRTRLVTEANLRSNINLSGRATRGMSKKQKNAMRVKRAARSANKYVFLETDRGAGIFFVSGGGRDIEVKMVWDLSRPTVVIQPYPWLEPAFEEATLMLPKFYRDRLEQQLVRRRLF